MLGPGLKKKDPGPQGRAARWARVSVGDPEGERGEQPGPESGWMVSKFGVGRRAGPQGDFFCVLASFGAPGRSQDGRGSGIKPCNSIPQGR